MEGDNNNEWTDTGSITFLLNWNLNKASEHILRSQSVLKETNSAQQALLSTTQKENEKKTKTINNLHTQLKAAECTIEDYKAKLAFEIKLKEEQKEIMQNELNRFGLRLATLEKNMKKAELETKSLHKLLNEVETGRYNRLQAELIRTKKAQAQEIEESKSLKKKIENKEFTIEQQKKIIEQQRKMLDERKNRVGQLKRKNETWEREKEKIARIVVKRTRTPSLNNSIRSASPNNSIGSVSPNHSISSTTTQHVRTHIVPVKLHNYGHHQFED